jgi:S-adenosylmethionine hydrolase
MRKKISDTFHGRDIFSPVAAHLAKGIKASDMGPEIHDPVAPGFVKPVVLNGEIEGEFIHIDDFGNLISNITLRDLKEIGTKKGEIIQLKIKDRDLTLRFCSAYGEVSPGMPLAIIGSGEFLEVSVNQGNASQFFNAKIQDKVRIKKL